MARSRALPASYAGTRFRSHLEVKWAVFFDYLDIKWDYEPQGFATDGEGYLPDYYAFLACGRVWIEVKPDWEADSEGIDRWRRFAYARPVPSRTRAALLVGPPAVGGKYTLIGGSDFAGDPVKGGWEDDAREWRPCPSGHHFDLAWPGTWRTKFAEDSCPDDFGYGGEGRIEKAVESALSHRFGKAT